jgi:hypothetical protein
MSTREDFLRSASEASAIVVCDDGALIDEQKITNSCYLVKSGIAYMTATLAAEVQTGLMARRARVYQP